MKRNTLLLSALAISTVITPTAFASPILDFNNPDFNGAVASQNDVGGFGNFATVWTSYNLGGASNVDEVAWIGSYFNPPSAGTITGFTLNFYTDAAGSVGSLIATRTIGGNAGESFLGNDNVGDPTYLYDTLITPLGLSAGTGWLSVVPDLTFPPQWGWETGVNAGGSYQDFFGTVSPLGTTESYALYGTAAPEPASMAALGLGVVALVRRRKNAR